MEINTNLKTPKAIYRTPVPKYRSNKGLDNVDFSLITPKFKGSFNKLPCANLKISKGKISRFAFQKELEKDFEEIAVKNEIFSILNNESTWCESFDHKNFNFPIDLESNSNLFEDNSFEIDDASEIRSKNLILKDFNLIECNNIENDNLSSLTVYIACKKLD